MERSAGEESWAQSGKARMRAAIACGKNATARNGMRVRRAAARLAGVTRCIHCIVFSMRLGLEGQLRGGEERSGGLGLGGKFVDEALEDEALVWW